MNFFSGGEGAGAGRVRRALIPSVLFLFCAASLCPAAGALASCEQGAPGVQAFQLMLPLLLIAAAAAVLCGSGTAFVEIDGSVVEYELRAGEKMIVDTGYLAMMDATCTMDVQTVKGVKNALFGGEGLFNTVVTGPGRVVLQTMPLINFASAVAGMIPSSN